MSQSSSPVLPRRFLAAALSAVIHAAALALLLLWQFSPSTREGGPALTVVDLTQPPSPEPDPSPPPSPEPQPTPGAAMAGEAAPPAPKAEAAPLAAAIPIQIPTFAPAPVPSTGTAARSGAALAGSGSGAGGQGTGTGGGGTGAGGGQPSPRLGTEPEAIRGYFKRSDYPKALRETGPEGSTWAEVTVGTNGRPLSCRITRPSGIPQFDEQTCRILMTRFRFRPGRDPSGRPVAAPWEVGVDWDYVDLNEE